MSIASVVFTDHTGTANTLTYNSTTGAWEGTISAGSASSYPQTNHFFPTSVTATDSFGNTKTVDTTDADFGSDLELYVKEKVAPVVTITAPSSGAKITSSTPSLVITVTDISTQTATEASGLNLEYTTFTLDGVTYTMARESISQILDFDSTRDVTIDSVRQSDLTPLAVTVNTTFLSLADGQHTLSVVVPDIDGNASVAATTTFTVDTVAPSLDVPTPADGLETNVANWTVAGTTSDVTSNPVTVTIKLDNVDQGTVTVGQGGAFTKTGTYSTEGQHTFTIRATDAAGKYTEITRTVTYSTTLPEFLEITLVPNPVDAGQTYLVSVKVQ